MVQAVTLAHRADQCSKPKQKSSTAWLTATEMTDTMVYRIILRPSGERARSRSAEGDRAIAVSVPAPAVDTHIMAAEGAPATRPDSRSLNTPPDRIRLGVQR